MAKKRITLISSVFVVLGLFLLSCTALKVDSTGFPIEGSLLGEVGKSGLIWDSVLGNRTGKNYYYLRNIKMNANGEVVVIIPDFNDIPEYTYQIAHFFIRNGYNVVVPSLYNMNVNKPYKDRYRNPSQDIPPYYVGDQVQRLNEVLGSLQLGKVHLVGVGYGIGVISLYAQDYPVDVSTLVFIKGPYIADLVRFTDRGDGVITYAVATGEKHNEVYLRKGSRKGLGSYEDLFGAFRGKAPKLGSLHTKRDIVVDGNVQVPKSVQSSYKNRKKSTVKPSLKKTANLKLNPAKKTETKKSSLKKTSLTKSKSTVKTTSGSGGLAEKK